jgi:hypothetical protein
VPQHLLVRALVDVAREEVLDELGRLGPERLGVVALKVPLVLADELQELGRLLGLAAANLLLDAVRAVLDVLETLKQRLEHGEEDVDVLVAVKVVKDSREGRVGFESPVDVEKIGSRPVLALLQDDGPGHSGEPATIGDGRGGRVLGSVRHLFLVRGAHVWRRLLAPRGRAVFLLCPAPAAIAAGVEYAPQEIRLLAVAAGAAIRELGQRAVLFLLIRRFLEKFERLLDSLVGKIKELWDEGLEELQDPSALLGIVLAADVDKDDHETQEVEEQLLVLERVLELVSRRLALGHPRSSLLLVLGLDDIHKMLRREIALIIRLDLDAHVIETLEVHRLGLLLPDLFPLTLHGVSKRSTVLEPGILT